MRQYLEIVSKIMAFGYDKGDRTGVGSRSIAGCFFEHDMSEGFPLLTTKKVPFHLVAQELQFFIHGITDKEWLRSKSNHIWDEWCSSDKVSYGHDDETQKAMMEERELGPIYGFQWRHFGANYIDYKTNYTGQGVDQLQYVIDTLKTNPTDRRMYVSAWNPVDLHRMALPPCHLSWQVIVTGDKLNLVWYQRSVDSFLGLPFNIASYSLLLHLLSKETGFQEGRVCGFLGDTHIYMNHFEQAQKLLDRKPYDLPMIKTHNFTSIFDWQWDDTKVIGYRHHPGIKAPIAV